MTGQEGEEDALTIGKDTARSVACKVLDHFKLRVKPSLATERSEIAGTLVRSGAVGETGTSEDRRAKVQKATARSVAKAVPWGPNLRDKATSAFSVLGGRGGALAGKCLTLISKDLLVREKSYD